jgi:hypothetical protein
MSSITRMTKVTLEILAAPFLMSAALVDELWDNATSVWDDAKSEGISRREWDGRPSAEPQETNRAEHRKHRKGRSARTVSHSRKAA